MALELKIGAVNTSPISLNYEELKRELAAKVEPYKGLIVTEDAIATAKSDLANLRRLMKTLDDRRKEIKKEYEVPLKEFEAQIKDIIAVANEAADNIDSQIKAFEKSDDEKKLGRIKLYFNLAFGELAKVVKFDAIYNPRWLNKGYRMPEIEAEISKMANDLRDNVDAVKALKSENEDALLRKLYETLDMGAVMKEQAALNAIAEERKARIAQMVEEAKKVLNDSDADKEKLESAAKELSDKIMPIGAKMYQSTQEDSKKDEPKSNDKSSDDDAVEGEVVDK